MPTPNDPDIEDNRNDRDPEEETAEERERDEDDIVEVRYDLFEDDDEGGERIDFELDDLRDMDGPDA